MDSNKVLLVEDNEIAQLGAIMQLENLGYSVDTAETGKIAIELASQNSYLLIFMDIGLPDMQGFEVATKIIKICPNAVIIALTAHDNEEYQQAARQAGMKGYLTKPLTATMVNEYLTTLAKVS